MAKTAEARIRAGFGSTATDEYGVADSLVSNVLSLEKNFELPDITMVLHGQVELSASSSVDINLMTDLDAFEDAATFNYLNALIVINDTSAAEGSAGSILRVEMGDSGAGVRSLIDSYVPSRAWVNVHPGGLLIIAMPHNSDARVESDNPVITLVNQGNGSGNSVAKYGFVGVKH